MELANLISYWAVDIKKRLISPTSFAIVIFLLYMVFNIFYCDYLLGLERSGRTRKLLQCHTYSFTIMFSVFCLCMNYFCLKSRMSAESVLMFYIYLAAGPIYTYKEALAAVVTTFINPYMGMINDGLTHFLGGMGGASRVVLGMVLGGMMSIDMGGPFNKAAYVFGTAQLAEGNFEVMAAVMAGGMVPPIAIALCTTFFKSKFTEKERQSGIVNYIMGLSFITEGAIPFAAQDPLRVIPSCIIGSAIAGGLSMAFGCTLRAPHGGIFVLPTIGNPLMYLAAVVVGAAAGCVILGMLKKNAAQ